MVGNVLPMFLGHTLWSRFPSLPPISAVLDWWTMAVMVGVTGLIVFVVRFRMNGSWIMVGLLTFLSTMVPYAIGALMLRGNEDISLCGPWLAVMLLGGLYAQLAAAACAGAAIVTRN
jgi:hypothetical protein